MRVVFKIATFLIATSALLITPSAHLYAQQVYKSVDKQGRVTFSEIPPSSTAAESLLIKTSDSNPSLPYALQQTVSRYPVTLYTSNDCAPCINARLLLTQRGVPFTERTVNTNDDNEAYKRLNSDGTLPMMTIASQQIKGFDAGEFNQYLDAAGYPKTAALPRNYSNPTAAPLSVKKVAEKPAGVSDKPVAAEVRLPVPVNKANNPAGIRF